MTDPVRILEESPSEFSAHLLKAARAEKPSQALSVKMLSGLPVAGAAVAVAGAEAATHGTQGLWALATSKWGAVGITASVLGTGAYVFEAGSGAPNEPSLRNVQAVVGTVEVVPEPSDEDATAMSAPGDESPEPATNRNAPVAAPPKAMKRGKAIRREIAPGSSSDGLALELKLLDGVRAHLLAKDAKKAQALLSIYSKKFAHGALFHEATILRGKIVQLQSGK